MKIVHLCLTGSYNDNWNYQDNIIPKYHILDGHDVSVVTTTFIDSKKKKGYDEVESGSYTLENGISITRLPLLFNGILKKVAHKMRLYRGTYSTLVKERPDFIFIHGPQFCDIRQVKRYLKKNSNVKVVVDNHSDFSNSATNWLSEKILHRVIWKTCVQIISPFTTKFYGVIPARVDFLIDLYDAPKDKTELLVLAADDLLVEEANQPQCIEDTRIKYGYTNQDIVLVTGGKIDSSKVEVFDLIESVKKLENENVKLLIFGSVADELKDKFEAETCHPRIKYIGWVESNYTYKLLAASDIGIFPGRHSVLWEQSIGLGLPIVVKSWAGTKHVDIGGNCIFIENDNNLDNILKELTTNQSLLASMGNVAKKEGMAVFSYRQIARKVLIDCNAQ